MSSARNTLLFHQANLLSSLHCVSGSNIGPSYMYIYSCKMFGLNIRSEAIVGHIIMLVARWVVENLNLQSLIIIRIHSFHELVFSDSQADFFISMIYFNADCTSVIFNIFTPIQHHPQWDCKSVRRQASRFFVNAKIQKLVVNFFLNIIITFLATWGCASDFYKIFPKHQLINSKFFCGRKYSKT